MKKISGSASAVGRNAFSSMGSSSAGIVASIALDAIVIATFGMGGQTDAYYIANTIPLVLVNILGLQASRVVQPMFILKRKSDDLEGWTFLNLVLTTGTVVLATIAATGIICSSSLMRVQAA